MHYVYKYTSPSGKIYIGQTGRTQSKRSGGENGSCYHNSIYFFHAIQKYGIKNFKYEILQDNLTEEEAKLEEQRYIKLYDATNPLIGYNLTKGGDGNKKYDYELIFKLYNEGKTVGEIKKILNCSEVPIQSSLDMYGISGKDRISRSAGKYHIVTIYQYSKDKKLINTFNSIAEAERETGVSHSNIVANCKGRRKSAGGFIWSYKKLDV